MNPILPLWVLHVGVSGVGAPPAPAELARFSAHWSVRFAAVPALAAAQSSGPLEPERNAVERIEALFDATQSALGALDPGEASQSLAEAERLIQAHPEFPQAAWLLAECHRLRAELLGTRDSAGARAYVARAAALEGARVAPFREGTSADIDPGSATPLNVDVRGLGPSDRLEWDSEARNSPVQTGAGEHQLRVLRGERVVWASWVSLSANATELALNLPPVAACSAEDLGGTLNGERGPTAPPQVMCSQWAVARSNQGKLELALCRGSQCGDWYRAPLEPSPFAPPAQVLTQRSFPRWATYAIASVGAAAVAGAVLLETGVFGGGGDTRERWRYDGLR
ncbi:MAG TPA: hypothetical protein VG937_28915 [Polyangiaceae bacterium]|nr:hypothetical protein [Polyangiaceae bacterium]